MSFAETVLVDPDTAVNIRVPESSGILRDASRLSGLSIRLDHESRRRLPVRQEGESVWRLESGALVVIDESGRMVGAGRARPNRASVEVEFCVDPEWRELLEAPLAERFIKCIREERFDDPEFHQPFRWVTTGDETVANSLPGMRRRSDGRHRLALRPWLPWGPSGATPERTLVMAWIGSASATDIQAALTNANGVALGVTVTADADPLTVLPSADAGDGDPRRLDAEPQKLTREQLREMFGSIPRPLSGVLRLTVGYPKMIEVADRAAVQPLVAVLIHTGTSLDEVLVTSSDQAAVGAASDLGLRATQVCNLPDLRASRSEPRRSRDEDGAGDTSAAESDHGSEPRSAPGFVVAIGDEDSTIREGLEDPEVHALATSRPEAAWELRRQLAERQQ